MQADDKVNILIVDDQPEGRVALDAVLQDLGQNLFMAGSSREAFRHLLARDFAVILLDVQMPEMDGFETAEFIRMRARSRHTPIIFLTAASNTEAHIFKGYAAGAVDYLSKPFVPEILRSKVMVFVELQKKTMLLEAANQKLTAAKEELRNLNEDLECRSMALEVANSELEAFAYSVSHDLRTPVRHIDGFVELLGGLVHGKLDEEGRQYLKIIAESAQRMGTLIDDLLAFSRVGRTEMQNSAVDLNQLVRDIVQELKPDMEGRDIVWDIEVLPAVQGDPSMLRLVVINLISNAIKYTRMQEQARIVIGSRRTVQKGHDSITVFVQDNGAGFDMQYVGKLFGVFQRLHSADDFEGTGVGLANVRRIVARHGGHTWAEGAVGRGATFFFSLPCAKGPQCGERNQADLVETE